MLGKPTRSKQSKLKFTRIKPMISRGKEDSPVTCRKYLPLMESEISIIHMPIAIAKIIFALFQMTILPRFLERLREDDSDAYETHTRRTINSEAVIKAM